MTRTLAALAAVVALLAAPATAAAKTQETAPSLEVVLSSISPGAGPSAPLGESAGLPACSPGLTEARWSNSNSLMACRTRTCIPPSQEAGPSL